ENGRAPTPHLGDYKLPTVRDVPPLETVLLPSEHGDGPYNIRGIGEAPCCPVAPAIANAVADAVGVRIRSLPITAQKVHDGRAKYGREGGGWEQGWCQGPTRGVARASHTRRNGRHKREQRGA